MTKVQVFKKSVKLYGKKIMVPLESSCHKEHTYEIPIIYHSKYRPMANVKVFEKWVKLQGHKVKNVGTNRKVLS
jgi:hypothetical protein